MVELHMQTHSSLRRVCNLLFARAKVLNTLGFIDLYISTQLLSLGTYLQNGCNCDPIIYLQKAEALFP